MSQGVLKVGQKVRRNLFAIELLQFFLRRKHGPMRPRPHFLEDAMSNLQRVDRLLSVKDIKANRRNARTHSKAQIGQISDSIQGVRFWRSHPGG
jgi:hypothetical protein